MSSPDSPRQYKFLRPFPKRHHDPNRYDQVNNIFDARRILATPNDKLVEKTPQAEEGKEEVTAMNCWRMLTLVGIIIIAIVYWWAWTEVSPPEADLPPIHFMLLLGLLAVGTFAAWRTDRRLRRERR